MGRYPICTFFTTLDCIRVTHKQYFAVLWGCDSRHELSPDYSFSRSGFSSVQKTSESMHDCILRHLTANYSKVTNLIVRREFVLEHLS